MKVIQSSVDEGFNEAKSILGGMGVMDMQVVDLTVDGNIDKTYKLIQQGFANFVAATKAKITAESGVTDQANGSTTSTDTSTKAAS